MIARWHPPAVKSSAVKSADVARARRIAARQLLPDDSGRIHRLRPAPAWAAWCITAWMMAATAAYLASTLGLLRWPAK